ncbi:cytochrome P450 [Patellaria atrata CBS 101060]|uniref:Cytochrome P450 n=1 Tax=Patellaria atrata CBS 101060 TaxID=1346257 RepID=A0A9P4VPZ2_9PEZI|nr:cytochrome P450 [Patellaria atrata CBS 101060]
MIKSLLQSRIPDNAPISGIDVLRPELTVGSPNRLVFGPFFLFLLLIFVKRRYFSPISDIPGPFSASFGHWWQWRRTLKGGTEKETIALHQKHGNFVRISHKEVSIGHPDAIKALLVAPLPKGSWYQVFNLPDKRYVNQMGELDPTRHIHKARNVAPGYAFSNVIKSEPYVDEAIRTLEDQLGKLSQDNKEVDFSQWFNWYGFDILGEVTFSKSFGFLKEGRDVGDSVANTAILAVYICIIGHVYWLHSWLLANPLIDKFNLRPSLHILDTCFAALDARKKSGEARKDMVEQWKETRAKHPDRMEEKEILAGCLVNIGAGADTISSALQAFFYHAIRTPGVYNQLRKEVDEAQARGELSAVVSHAEAQNLPYLQATIKEALRFHTPIGFGFPRVAPAGGITILDRHFPEGVTLSVNPWVIHRNKELFGDDADVFNPDRWMDAERAKEMNKYMIPFGAGYNQCPGRHLAHMELSKLTATLVRDFDIVQVNPKQEWKFETHFTAVPYGWPCKVRRRNRGT